MSKLTLDQMIEIMDRHDRAEADGDVAATMATVVPNPCWELHPLGYFIQTHDAVAEFYRRILPAVKDMVLGLEKKNLWSNDTGYIVEYRFDMIDRDGAPFTSRFVTAFEFEDELVKAERGFLGSRYAAIVEEILGADFPTLPGVTVER